MAKESYREHFENEGQLYVIHRKVSESHMNPQNYGLDSTGNSTEDVSRMVKCWAGWLKDNCKTIDKVFLAQGAFLFCELIPEVNYEDIKNEINE